MLILSILIITSNKSSVNQNKNAIIFSLFSLSIVAQILKEQKGGFAYILGTNLTLKKEVSITFWLKPLLPKFRPIFTSKTQCLCEFWFVQQFGTNHLFFEENLEYKNLL